MTEKSLIVNSDAQCAEMLETVRRLYKTHRHVCFHWDTERQRTLTQSRALHLFLRWLAETLNDAGLDVQATLKPGVEIPWNEHLTKELIWKPVQKAMFDKESTTEANRTDYGEVYDVIARHMAQKHGLTIPPWPSIEGDA